MKIIWMLILFLLTIATSYAKITVTAGTPERTGVTDEFDVTIDGRVITVEVPLSAADRMPETKADSIATAMKGKGVPGVSHKPGSKDIVIDSARVTTITPTRNPSGEKVSVVAPHAQFGAVSFVGTISGHNDRGTPSVFQASLGFTGVTASVDLSLADLASPTVDTLLTAIYNQFLAELPSSLQSELSLDLAHELIGFNFPANRSDYFVTNFTSDSTLQATLTMVIPEPSVASALALGILSILGCGYVRLRANARNTGPLA